MKKFNLTESEKNRIRGLHGMKLINENKLGLEDKVAMVDCIETYDIPELVINVAGKMSDSMMVAVPEGKDPYSVWMAGFISNVLQDKRTDSKLLEDLKAGTGCMYDILSSVDMLDVIPK